MDNVRTFLPQNSFRVSLPGCGFVYFCGSMFTGMVGGIWILTTFFTWTKTEYCDSLIFAIVYLPFFVPRVLSMSTHFLTYSQCMEISRSSTKIRDTRSTPFSMYWLLPLVDLRSPALVVSVHGDWVVTTTSEWHTDTSRPHSTINTVSSSTLLETQILRRNLSIPLIPTYPCTLRNEIGMNQLLGMSI